MLIHLEGAHAFYVSIFGGGIGSEALLLALLGCHNVNATRYLGHLFAVAFWAPYPHCLVLRDGFGALK
jgi:hypothetical protein